jgi:hypothetical protein
MNLEAAGALGMIVINYKSQALIEMPGGDHKDTAGITIPAVMIAQVAVHGTKLCKLPEWPAV